LVVCFWVPGLVEQAFQRTRLAASRRVKQTRLTASTSTTNACRRTSSLGQSTIEIPTSSDSITNLSSCSQRLNCSPQHSSVALNTFANINTFSTNHPAPLQLSRVPKHFVKSSQVPTCIPQDRFNLLKSFLLGNFCIVLTLLADGGSHLAASTFRALR
jgi:hypothetical protein